MNVKLPHLRQKPEDEEPFETMEREMAKVHQFTHPHYDEADIYGNKAPQPQDGSATMEPVTTDEPEDTDDAA